MQQKHDTAVVAVVVVVHLLPLRRRLWLMRALDFKSIRLILADNDFQGPILVRLFLAQLGLDGLQLGLDIGLGHALAWPSVGQEW